MGFDGGGCILLGVQCVGNCHGRGYKLPSSRRLLKLTCTSLNLHSYTEMVGLFFGGSGVLVNNEH